MRRSSKPRRRALQVELLEGRLLPSGTSPLAPNQSLAGALRAGEQTTYRVALDQPGEFTIQLKVAGFAPRLELADNRQNYDVESDGSPADPNTASLTRVVNVPAGQTEELNITVAAAGAGSGSYDLTSQFQPKAFPLQQLAPNPLGADPRALVKADFNGDGQTDLASANAGDGTVSILLGQGGGTFQTPQTIHLAGKPVALVAADLNHDGRPDLAVVQQVQGQFGVTILLGEGDGTFRALPGFFAVGADPRAIAVADLNADGKLDLVTADAGSNDVAVLLGNGDGTFQPALFQQVNGSQPVALVTGDFDGDGHVDVATANAGSNNVSFLFGLGTGRFDPTQRQVAVQVDPQAIVAADFTGSRRLDLAVANSEGDTQNFTGSVSLLTNQGSRVFSAQVLPVDPGAGVSALAVADFDGDGRPDLATLTPQFGGIYHILLNQGGGSFTDPAEGNTGGTPAAFVVDDLDHDGIPDFAFATSGPQNVEVHLVQGPVATSFFSLRPAQGTNPLSKPLLADLNGDGLADSVTLDATGRILVRLGQTGNADPFGPLLVVNPGQPALDITIAHAGPRNLLAAVGQGQVRLFGLAAAGTPSLVSSLAIGGAASQLNARIVAADLRGAHDGFDDLAVLNPATGYLTTFLNDGHGGFPGPGQATNVGGTGPAELRAADVDGNGTADLLVLNQQSGDVSVVLSDGSGTTLELRRFQTGTGTFGITPDPLDPQGQTFLADAQSTDFAVADVNGDGIPDLVVAEAGTNSLSVLLGQGAGRFLDPQSIPLGFTPGSLAVGDLSGDGKADIAVLNETSQTVAVLLGDGQGNFQPQLHRDSAGNVIPLLAGPGASGLALRDLNGDGKADLQVGNGHGDVLNLLGQGDGTFAPAHASGQSVTLAVADLSGDGKQEVVLADQGLNRVSVQAGAGFAQSAADGILSPAAVKLADLNGDGIPDLVVSNSGGNDLLVYLGLGNGQFAPAQTYFTGTNPQGVTIQDLNGDGSPDVVVANQGSNDVSVFFGQGTGSSFTLSAGPRLQSGGSSPVSAVVSNVTGSGNPDLLVANQGSSNVAVLPGVGQGFFNDQGLTNQGPGGSASPGGGGSASPGGPSLHTTGQGPSQIVPFNQGFVTVNTGDNTLSFFPNLLTSPAISIPSGGLAPVAAAVASTGANDVLAVANSGSGNIALFGGAIPSLLAVETVAGVTQPSDLVVTSATADAVSLLVTQEGVEGAFPVTFAFGAALTASLLTAGALTSVPQPLLIGALGAAAELEPGVALLAPGLLTPLTVELFATAEGQQAAAHFALLFGPAGRRALADRPLVPVLRPLDGASLAVVATLATANETAADVFGPGGVEFQVGSRPIETDGGAEAAPAPDGESRRINAFAGVDESLFAARRTPPTPAVQVDLHLLFEAPVVEATAAPTEPEEPYREVVIESSAPALPPVTVTQRSRTAAGTQWVVHPLTVVGVLSLLSLALPRAQAPASVRLREPKRLRPSRAV